MIKTDILIIGAGPVGLFTVFEAGLLKLKCHIIDALPMIGGQLAEIYPKKPIYDIPGFPTVLAGDLIKNLEEQISPFKPTYTLGDRAETIEKQEDGSFIVTTKSGIKHHAPVVAIAGGLGSFEPRKPPIPNLTNYEDNGVEYIIREPELYRDKKIIIAGGGDSALDWSIFLTNVAKEVTLVHRRTEFRGALDSVEKVQELVAAGKMKLLTNSEIKEIHGKDRVKAVSVKHKTDGNSKIEVAHFIPLFGLSPKLGPIGNWGLEIEKNAIVVDNATDYRTSIDGLFAIGDINTYPGKLKLILCGFHEATIMVQSAYKIINPDAKRLVLKYTTVSGVTGFDGVKKE